MCAQRKMTATSWLKESLPPLGRRGIVQRLARAGALPPMLPMSSARAAMRAIFVAGKDESRLASMAVAAPALLERGLSVSAVSTGSPEELSIWIVIWIDSQPG